MQNSNPNKLNLGDVVSTRLGVAVIRSTNARKTLLKSQEQIGIELVDARTFV